MSTYGKRICACWGALAISCLLIVVSMIGWNYGRPNFAIMTLILATGAVMVALWQYNAARFLSTGFSRS